jgi:hypothetical protein
MIFSKLAYNYGHAGPIYMQWVVPNRDKAVAEQIKWQRRLDKDLSYTGRERFWSAGSASMFAGGAIAKKLGLINFDLDRIYEWALGELNVIKRNVVKPGKNSSGVLGGFLNESNNNILIINELSKLSVGLPEAPIREPKGPLHIRMEPDTRRMYISTKAIRSYCTKNQIAYKDFITSLTNDKILLQTTKKRLSKGTHIVTPAVDVLEIDTTVAGVDMPVTSTT